MSKTPGTVSKILWHFTGGPEWDREINKQKKTLKRSQLAFEILNKIIDQRILMTGSFSEVSQSLAINRDDDDIMTISTRPVCCLADIPIQHLSYHAKRYGKFAIGFHRHNVGPQFNPVLYNAIGSDLNIQIGLLHQWGQDEGAFKLEKLLREMGLSADPQYREVFDLIEDIQMNFTVSSSLLVDVLTYSKSFNSNSEFGTIYCEREWRSTQDFYFEPSDIAMVVLPRRGGFYNRFLQEQTELLKFFSVVAWEDLVEH